MFPRTDRDVTFPVIGAVGLFSLMVGTGLLYQLITGTGSAERLVTIMLIDAIIVIGIQIYVGNTGVLSFGHVGFGSIAGYVFAWMAIPTLVKQQSIPDAPFNIAGIELHPALAILIAIGATLVVAFIVGLGLARSGAASGAISASVITLALLFVVNELAGSLPELTVGDRAGLSFGVGNKLDSRWPIYLALLLSLVVARLYATSRGGRLAVAAREDDLAARAMGVNPLVQQMIALLVSVAVVSLGASLRVWENGSILPDNFFFNYALLTLVMLIVGGRNSVTGAVLGVAVMTAGREISRQMGRDGFAPFGIDIFDSAPLDWVFRPNLQTVFLGVSMLGFMIWRPKGLLDDWELDHWLRRRVRRDDGEKPKPLAEIDERTPAKLTADGITVRFGGFTALDGAGLVANSGEIVGIIGPNGAGKTTFVNVVTGLVTPTSGTVHIDGDRVNDLASFELARAGLVRTFQNLRLFSALTVRQNVEASALVAQQHRSDQVLPDVDSVIAEAGLWEHRDRRASELDYGNSRRLELARAVAMAPTFLLLDEPTSGMSDTESIAMIEQVRHMAATIGAGVIVIDHDLGFITGISDRIYVLDQGRIIADGTPAEVQADPQVRAAYLGSAAS